MRRLFAQPLALALLLALLVRLLPATWNYVIGGDEALYLTLGGHIAAGDGFTADGIRPHSEFDPGYPLFAAAIDRVTGVIPFAPTTTAKDVFWLELPARLNLLLLGSLLVVPIYFLARELNADKHFAARAALLTATVPALALGVPNFEAASEQLYTLALWSGWLFLFLGLNRERAFWFLLAGLAFGLAHLTRYEGLVSAGMAVVVAAVWLWFTRRESPPRARAALNLGALLVGVLLLAAPYALYQTARTGSVFSTKSIVHQLHGEALASSDPYAWEKAYDNYERVRDNPGLYPPLPVYLWERRERTVALYARNTILQLQIIMTSPTFLFLLWLPFAVLGALRFGRARNLFLAATLAPALVYPLSVVDGRYLLPLVPAGMLWAARGLAVSDAWRAARVSNIADRLMVSGAQRSRTIVSRFSSLISRMPSEPALSVAKGHPSTVALVALFILTDLIAIFFIPRPVEYRSAGLALRGSIPTQAPVLMRRRQIAFYANVSYESIPFSDLQGVLAYARQKGALYFIVDDRSTPATRPQLVYLLGPPPAGIETAYESPSTPRVIVYRIP